MTILPKKKQNKEKNENDNSDGSQNSPGAEGGSGRGAMARVRPCSPGGPQRWASPPPVDHEPPGRYEDCASSHGTVGNNKRRIRDRSSPHRTVRKQRHETGSRTTATCQTQATQAAGSGASTRGLCGRQQAATASSDARLVASTSHNSQGGSEEDDEREGGFNSEDECSRPYDATLAEKEKEFEMMLKEKKGFVIKRMAEDGACLFRAVADQVYGDQEMHSIVRLNCVDYMSKNMDFFKQFVTEDFNEYLSRKRIDSCHGNHIEMQALCELYNRPIEVYQLSLNPINTFHGSYKTDNEPIRLSYHNNIHYNSVVNPHKATIGVGLGLPGYQPGLADKNLVRDAVRQSEDCQIEQTMLEDKLRETDWELTQETIEEQVARESYLQWLRDQEKLGKSKASPRTATCSSSSENQQHHLWWEVADAPKTPRNKLEQSCSPRQLEGGQSPKSPLYQCTSSMVPHPPGATTSKSATLLPDFGAIAAPDGFTETSSLMNELPPQLFGLHRWDDDTGMLAQAIAESQQQYLNDLKLAAKASSPKSPPTGGGSPDGSPPSSGKGKSLMPKDKSS